MRFSSLVVSVATLTALAGASVARAAPINSVKFNDGTVLNVAATVGAGSSSAYLVLNYANGLDVAYQYKFDGSPSATDELKAIDAADPNLTVDLQSFPGLGNYVSNILYNGTGSVQDGNHYLAFYTGTYSASAVSSANPQGTSFDYAANGIDLTTLANGSYVAFVDTDFTSTVANLPVLPSTVAAVPEPATAGLFAVAVGGGCLRRRRRS